MKINVVNTRRGDRGVNVDGLTTLFLVPEEEITNTLAGVSVTRCDQAKVARVFRFVNLTIILHVRLVRRRLKVIIKGFNH